MDLRDRRKHYRLRIRMNIRVDGEKSPNERFTEEAETVNVSLEGVSFLTKRDYSIGQLVTVAIPGKCRIEARIVWVGDESADGRREVGAVLVPPIVNWVIR